MAVAADELEEENHLSFPPASFPDESSSEEEDEDECRVCRGPAEKG